MISQYGVGNAKGPVMLILLRFCLKAFILFCDPKQLDLSDSCFLTLTSRWEKNQELHDNLGGFKVACWEDCIEYILNCTEHVHYWRLPVTNYLLEMMQ